MSVAQSSGARLRRGSDLKPNKLPMLHLNARSRRITSGEAREVFVEEITRGLDRRLDKDEYLRSVMP